MALPNLTLARLCGLGHLLQIRIGRIRLTIMLTTFCIVIVFYVLLGRILRCSLLDKTSSRSNTWNTVGNITFKRVFRIDFVRLLRKPCNISLRFYL